MSIITSVHLQFSSVQFSHSVVSDSLQPHESQHARPPSPSPTHGVHSDSRPSSQWCHPAISSSVIPFSSCPQSLPASESFPMSQLFAWGGLLQCMKVKSESEVAQSCPVSDSSWPHGLPGFSVHGSFQAVPLPSPNFMLVTIISFQTIFKTPHCI